MNILISILVSGVSLVGLYLLFAALRWKEFEANLKNGDKVDWYCGEERRTYRLERKGEKWSEIRSELGHIRKVLTDELHPNLFYRYQKRIYYVVLSLNSNINFKDIETGNETHINLTNCAGILPVFDTLEKAKKYSENGKHQILPIRIIE